ncbi:MFS transporter [Blastococcus sp. SYSU DS0619]
MPASVHVLWAGQAVSGLGAGLLLPTTLALIAHAVPDFRARGRYVGMWATGMVAGLAVGPLISGGILEFADWGWVFAPIALLALAAAVTALRHLPESKTPAGRHLDWAGQITATIAIAASIYGVIEGGEAGWDSPQALVGLAVGAAALVAFVVAERRSSSPLMDLTLFRSPAFSAAGFAAVIILFCVVGTMFLLSLFLGYVQQLSPLEIGVRLLFVSGVSVVVNQVLGRLAGHVPPIRLLTSGLLLSAVGVLLLTGVDETTGFADLAWRLAVFGASMSLMLAPLSVVAINSVPWQLAGMAAAGNTALRQYGGALGPAVLGVVIADRLGAGASQSSALHTALLVNVALLLLAALGCLLAARARPAAPAAA